MNDNSRIVVPVLIVLFGLFIIGYSLVPPSDSPGQMGIQEFGTIPVVDGGRPKPFDTFARTTLFAISDSQTYKDEKDVSQPAVKWVLDVMTQRKDPETGVPYWVDSAVFYIPNDQVLSLLHLKPRSGLRYSFREIMTGVMKEDYEEAIANNQKPPPVHNDNYETLIREATKAEQRDASQRDLYEVKLIDFANHIVLLRKLLYRETPLMVPPAKGSPEWQRMSDCEIEENVLDPNHKEAQSLYMALAAYRANLPEDFNHIIDSYKMQVAGVVTESESNRMIVETFFNHFAPFSLCAILYVLVFVLSCVSWIGWRQQLLAGAFWLAVLTALVHTWAIFTRMYLLERPLVFVTNLYSSAIFIGWVAVLLCLFLERIFKNSIGLSVGAVIGSLTLFIAHNIAVGDTLEMMQAVLDTNFWLATHVTSVTIGYTATLVSGFIGIAYIITGVFTPNLTRDLMRTFGQMLYGVICFAMTFSFIGTVLGGIWADQSWGRFWGWDPKENGALLIVIWNALILHARWGGMVKQRGMAVLAVAGNIVTAWSWFGTNMLGVGLHSYGFMHGALFWLLFCIFAHVGMICVGLIPVARWTSFSTKPSAPNTLVGPMSRTKGKQGVDAIQPA